MDRETDGSGVSRLGRRLFRGLAERATEYYTLKATAKVERLVQRAVGAPKQPAEFSGSIAPQVLSGLIQIVYAGSNRAEREKFSRYLELYEIVPPDFFSDEAVRQILKGEEYEVRVFRKKNLTVSPKESEILFVVVVRGTKAHCSDFADNLRVIMGQLHESKKLKIIRTLIHELVRRYGENSVCVTGHSLGAAMALHVARELFLKGKEVETHLFHPPYHYNIVEAGMKLLLEVMDPKNFPGYYRSNDTSPRELEGSAVADSDEASDAEDKAHVTAAAAEFERLARWRPYLYLNFDDEICNGFVRFFKGRSSLPAAGLKTNYLIPSAILYIHDCKLFLLSGSHSIGQWEDFDPRCITHEHYVSFRRVPARIKK